MISKLRPESISSTPTKRPAKRLEEPSDNPCPAYRATCRATGTVVGVTLGLARLIVGGCAGGAQGVARGADASSERVAFALTLGANLALSGALAGAIGSLASLALAPAQGVVAGAIGNLSTGFALWKRSPVDYQDSVRSTADEWVGAATGKLPRGWGPYSLWQRIAIGLVGEVVGAAAGVYASAALLPSHFRQDYSAGQKLCERVNRWMSPKEEDTASGPGIADSGARVP